MDEITFYIGPVVTHQFTTVRIRHGCCHVIKNLLSVGPTGGFETSLVSISYNLWVVLLTCAIGGMLMMKNSELDLVEKFKI